MNCIEFPNYGDFFQKPSNSPKNAVEFIWLGQAGFVFRYNDNVILIDPYLSDYLSKKYKDTIFSHTRLMDIPLAPDKIKNVDFLLSTHPHSDHMDPETIPVLSKFNPNLVIIVPAPARDEAIKRGAPINALKTAKSEIPVIIQQDLEIIPIPAAHEDLKIDENGDHYFLGYIIKFGNKILYHSGDCVPYDGLSQFLRKYKVKTAFLPINGRDEYRKSHGIAGNFMIPEALTLCNNADISCLIVHHFGMFAYNTVTPKDLRELNKKSSSEFEIIIPKMFYKYTI